MTDAASLKIDLLEMHDTCMLSIWSRGGMNTLTGEQIERLPPRLWEPFRQRLQSLYRQATGEEFAVLEVKGHE